MFLLEGMKSPNSDSHSSVIQSSVFFSLATPSTKNTKKLQLRNSEAKNIADSPGDVGNFHLGFWLPEFRKCLKENKFRDPTWWQLSRCSAADVTGMCELLLVAGKPFFSEGRAGEPAAKHGSENICTINLALLT